MLYDVLIAGGGVIGCSVAFHLAAARAGLKIAVVERDPTYELASTGRSVGNARIQFSLEENIRISSYAFEAFDRFAEEMAVEGAAPDIRFRQEGNLFLVGEHRCEAARVALERQARLGCQIEWLNPDELAERYPFLKTVGLAGATFGATDGHLDGHALLAGYKAKARSLGVDFLEGEVAQIVVKHRRVTGLKLRSGVDLDGARVVNCTGAWAAELVGTAGIELPVRPVKRQAFFVETPLVFEKALPLIVLPSGLYFRSEGPGQLLVGRSLPEDEQGFSFSWQESRFQETLWPDLADRAPCFDRLRLVRGWAGLYAVNELDGNAIVGEWPEIDGLYLANGFSGHGLQQAPAVGRYLAESILGEVPKLDLSALGPARVIENRPLSEHGLV